MDSTGLLEQLGYVDCPHFLRAGTPEFGGARYVGHLLRHAQQDLPKRLESASELLGVYTLQQGVVGEGVARTPLVYVVHVEDARDLPELHRLIWCQDVVPFVLVHTPKGLQLHSGFEYQRTEGKTKGILQPLQNFNQCADLLQQFHSNSIDSGKLWSSRREDVRPEKRVDWRLLKSLKSLDTRLVSMGLGRDSSHALIGKYVFLKYLRDREILSDRKLATWGLEADEIFGRTATVKGLKECLDAVEDWLNGGVFPINWRGEGSPRADHVRAVAATLSGDEPVGDKYWQLAFDFQAYDFSYIPIETLSIIYEQFLHAPDESGKSKGKSQGAYYTPIPLVNLMLCQLEQRRPLCEGVKVLDPSCGSGAFLVQAYRRIIETTYPPGPKKPTPVQLRDLLTKQIYGVDRDPDACSVTELSLQMTLLDCVDPPDLESTGPQQQFKLPTLRGKNIVHADFFDTDHEELKSLERKSFDVILGNPPWKPISPNSLEEEDIVAWSWIEQHGLTKGTNTPVAGNQIAQAFTWRIRDFSHESDGSRSEVAFLIPGSALFEVRSKAFRSNLFSRYDVHTVVNFANLTEVLFARRSRVPAAAFFFSIPVDKDDERSSHINVFSPLVANQEANRGSKEGERPETWIIEVHENEVRQIDRSDVTSGSGLPWKVAQWGSHLDLRLLEKLKRRFPTLGQLEKGADGYPKILLASQGLELRNENSNEELDEVREVIGRRKLDVKKLERLRNVFHFPDEANSETVREGEHFVRKGRGQLPLKVCRPPHVIVSAARTFAVFCDEFLIIPPVQVGIIHVNNDINLLKALSLYLSSSFAFYQQFFTSSEFGVKRDRASLKSLRGIPIPLLDIPDASMKDWVRVHTALTKVRPIDVRAIRRQDNERLFVENDRRTELLGELNSLVYDALRLSDRERSLVDDLVHVRLNLTDGRIGAAAVSAPEPTMMKAYANRLVSELNAFVGNLLPKRFEAEVVQDSNSAMIALGFVNKTGRAKAPVVRNADAAEGKELQKTREKLRVRFSQWMYLNRNLRIYEGSRTYILKPMQRFHWTESQAMADAAEIFAESLEVGETE